MFPLTPDQHHWLEVATEDEGWCSFTSCTPSRSRARTCSVGHQEVNCSIYQMQSTEWDVSWWHRNKHFQKYYFYYNIMIKSRDTLAPCLWTYSFGWCLAEGYWNGDQRRPMGPCGSGRTLGFFRITIKWTYNSVNLQKVRMPCSQKESINRMTCHSVWCSVSRSSIDLVL